MCACRGDTELYNTLHRTIHYIANVAHENEWSNVPGNDCRGPSMHKIILQTLSILLRVRFDGLGVRIIVPVCSITVCLQLFVTLMM